MSRKVQKAKNAAQAGFTLIELMIVIAIIGILAAIAIPQYEQYIVTSKATTIAQDFHQLITQSTAAEAAAAAGQTTSVALPGSSDVVDGHTVVDGDTFTLSGGTPYAGGVTVSPTNSTIKVTLTAGSSTSLNNAVASALSAMDLQGSGTAGASTNTSNNCTGGNCTATIDSNGGITYSASGTSGG